MKRGLMPILRTLVVLSPLIYPAYLFRFKLAGVPFTALEVFVYLLFGLWLVAVVLGQASVAWDRKTRAYWISAFVLMVGATLGAFFSPVAITLPNASVVLARQVALGVWKGWVVAPILYFAVLTQVLRSEVDVKAVLRSFVYSGALVGLVAHGFALLDGGLTPDLRLRGFFESANYVALYVVPSLLVGMSLVASRSRSLRIWDYLDLSSVTVLAFTLLMTRSYAGILGVFGAIALWVVALALRHPAHRKRLLWVLGAVVMVFAVTVATQIGTQKFRQFMDFSGRSSTSVRLEIYQVSWHLVRQHPILGVGPGLFQANYQTLAPQTLGHVPFEWNMPHPHNIFLGFWLNAGLLGLLALLALIVLAHRKYTWPLIALWGILIHGLFDMPFWKNDLAMIFWLILAVILVLQKTRGSIDK